MNDFSELKFTPVTEAVVNFTNALYAQGCFDLLSKEEIRDILSLGQLASKIWLLNTFSIIFRINPSLHHLTI